MLAGGSLAAMTTVSDLMRLETDAGLRTARSELVYRKRLDRVLLKPREINIDAESGA